MVNDKRKYREVPNISLAYIIGDDLFFPTLTSRYKVYQSLSNPQAFGIRMVTRTYEEVDKSKLLYDNLSPHQLRDLLKVITDYEQD